MPICSASSRIEPASLSQSGASSPLGPVMLIAMPGLDPMMPCSTMSLPKMTQPGGWLVNPGLRWSKNPNGCGKSL